MKAYKLKESVNHYEKGRVFCNFETQTLLVATPTKPQAFIYNSTLSSLISKGLTEEILLEDEKKLFPHFYKPLREQILKEMNNS